MVGAKDTIKQPALVVSAVGALGLHNRTKSCTLYKHSRKSKLGLHLSHATTEICNRPNVSGSFSMEKKSGKVEKVEMEVEKDGEDREFNPYLRKENKNRR